MASASRRCRDVSRARSVASDLAVATAPASVVWLNERPGLRGVNRRAQWGLSTARGWRADRRRRVRSAAGVDNRAYRLASSSRRIRLSANFAPVITTINIWKHLKPALGTTAGARPQVKHVSHRRRWAPVRWMSGGGIRTPGYQAVRAGRTDCYRVAASAGFSTGSRKAATCLRSSSWICSIGRRASTVRK